MQGGRETFLEKGSPSPHPTLPKTFAGEPVQGQRDYAVHQLRPSIFFSSICDVCASLHRGTRPLSLRILMRILGVRRDGLRLFGSTSQAAGVEKFSGLERRQETSCSCGTGDSCREGAPSSLGDGCVRRKGRGTAVGWSSRAGKEWGWRTEAKRALPGSCGAPLSFFILR